MKNLRLIQILSLLPQDAEVMLEGEDNEPWMIDHIGFLDDQHITIRTDPTNNPTEIIFQ